MEIDSVLREKLAAALAAYLRGEMLSDALDAVVWDVHDAPTADREVREIALAIWSVYDDFVDHPVCVNEQEWQALRRYLAFLKARVPLRADADYRPFPSRAAWPEHEGLLDEFRLPPYDPIEHGRRRAQLRVAQRKYLWSTWGVLIGSAVVVLLIVAGAYLSCR